jgi:hypothetical protein
MNGMNVATQDLAGVFRSLSTKRRNGVLEIKTEDSVSLLSFVDGRIAYVERLDESLVRKVCERLVTAGLLEQAFLDQVFVEDRTLSEMMDLLSDKRRIQKEVLQRAVRSYQLDVIHSLRHAARIRTDFKPKVLELDPDYCLSLAPGQLLLDLVELESDDERFTKVFGNASENTLSVRKTQLELKNPSDSSKVIWELFRNTCPLRQLYERALLCEFEVRGTLLGLYDSKAVELATGVAQEAKPVSAGASLFQKSGFLEKLSEEFSEDLDLLESGPGEREESENAPEVNEPTLRVERVAAVPKNTSFNPWCGLGAYEDECGDNERDDSETSEEEPVIQVQEKRARSLSEMFFDMNCALREERGLHAGATVATVVVLMVVGMMLPSLIQDLFDALQSFSSNYSGLRGNLGVFR